MVAHRERGVRAMDNHSEVRVFRVIDDGVDRARPLHVGGLLVTRHDRAAIIVAHDRGTIAHEPEVRTSAGHLDSPKSSFAPIRTMCRSALGSAMRPRSHFASD